MKRKETLLLLLLIFIPILSATLYGRENARRHYWNKSRGYEPFSNAKADGIYLRNSGAGILKDGLSFETPVSIFNLSFRAANLTGHPSKKYKYEDSEGKTKKMSNPEWGFYIASSLGDTLKVMVKGEEIVKAIDTESALNVMISLVSATSPARELYSESLKKGLDLYEGSNQWQVEKENGIILIKAGNRVPLEVYEITFEGEISGFGFLCGRGCELKVNDIILEIGTADNESNSIWIKDGLPDLPPFDENDMLQGYWMTYDRELEESLLKMGGDYMLAIVKDGERYALVYLAGARTNAEKWTPGMIKGYIDPMPFPGVFDVVWIDSEGKELSHDVKATVGEGQTLVIQFPYQSSVLRLKKMPK